MCTSNVIEANYSKYGWIRNLEEEKEVFRKSCKKRKIASVLLCSISDLHANCIKAFPFEYIRKKNQGKKASLFCTFTMPSSSVRTVFVIYFFGQVCYYAFTVCEAKPINWSSAGNSKHLIQSPLQIIYFSSWNRKFDIVISLVLLFCAKVVHPQRYNCIISRQKWENVWCTSSRSEMQKAPFLLHRI